MGKILAICISEERGTKKKQIPQGIFLEEFGIRGDAHAGKWHRQVSLLSAEKIREFRQRGALVEYGDFGENLVVEGFDLAALPVGTRLKGKQVILEITQIGKQCHHGCEIFKQMGDCIMPREGVFARVLQGGTLCVGDLLEKTEEEPS